MSSQLYLYGGVKFVLVTGVHSFKPLDHRLDVTTDFTLKGRASSIVHGCVDGVSASQDGFGVGTL